MKRKVLYAGFYAEVEQLCADLNEHYARTQNWRITGAAFGLNKATARLIANGYIPGKKVCKQLGITRYERRDRVTINLADPDSAARSIRFHGGPDFARRLIEALRKRD